jgi:hypothetical protein
MLAMLLLGHFNELTQGQDDDALSLSLTSLTFSLVRVVMASAAVD